MFRVKSKAVVRAAPRLRIELLPPGFRIPALVGLNLNVPAPFMAVAGAIGFYVSSLQLLLCVGLNFQVFGGFGMVYGHGLLNSAGLHW